MSDFQRQPVLQVSRRELLSTVGGGFGALGLAGLLQNAAPAANQLSHFAPRAKRAIFLFMSGGPSQVDTFAPQPRLNREDGRPFSMSVDKTTLQFDNMGKTLANP